MSGKAAVATGHRASATCEAGLARLAAHWLCDLARRPHLSGPPFSISTLGSQQHPGPLSRTPEIRGKPSAWRIRSQHSPEDLRGVSFPRNEGLPGA